MLDFFSSIYEEVRNDMEENVIPVNCFHKTICPLGQNISFEVWFSPSQLLLNYPHVTDNGKLILLLNTSPAHFIKEV